MYVNQENYPEFIQAREVKLGINVQIGEGTRILGPDGPADYVELGDNVFLDRDIFIMAPVFKMGDYGKIYKQCRVSGYKPCVIGHNFWCDQNSILNCTDELSIGDNVGIGAYSQLWTHIKFGDILEGCRFNSTKPMKIGHDVWFVGHCVVSPVNVGNKSMAMVGSVITRDMEENHIYGGAPAKDLTDKLGNQFAERSLDEKVSMMKTVLDDYAQLKGSEVLDLIKIVTSMPDSQVSKVSYFNVADRTYTKRRSETETDFMKFLLPSYKFVPFGHI